jgi:hypothetical protein
MYKIAITGDPDYIKKSTIGKFVKKIKDQFGTTATILSGGTEQGPDAWIKEYSFDFKLQYKEYNPSYTGYNKYSALDESYYGKKFHPSHLYDRYRRMLFESDRLVIFTSKKLTKELDYLIKNAEKKNIPYIIVN